MYIEPSIKIESNVPQDSVINAIETIGISAQTVIQMLDNYMSANEKADFIDYMKDESGYNDFEFENQKKKTDSKLITETNKLKRKKGIGKHSKFLQK